MSEKAQGILLGAIFVLSLGAATLAAYVAHQQKAIQLGLQSHAQVIMSHDKALRPKK